MHDISEREVGGPVSRGLAAGLAGALAGAAGDGDRTDAVVLALASAAERLLTGRSTDADLADMVSSLGAALGVERVAILQHHGGKEHSARLTPLHDWVAPGIGSQPPLPDIPLDPARREWQRRLRAGDPIVGPVRAFPPEEANFLSARHILSIALVPVFAREVWWGAIAFGQCTSEHAWTATELLVLRAASAMLGVEIERRRADSAFHESEDRYRRMVESSSEAIAVHRSGVITYANPAAARLVGARGPQELIGRSILEFVHPGSRPMVLTRLQRLREGKGVPMVEETFVRLDGTPVEVEVVTTPFPSDGEAAVQIVARDVTDRHRAERAIRESEARKSSILQAALDGVITMDHRGRVLEFNPAAEEMFGRKRDEVVGRQMAELLIPPGLRRRHRHALDRYLATGRATILGKRVETTAMAADGSEFPVELAVTRVDLPGPAVFTAYIRDITDRKYGEIALRRRGEYLAALHETALGLMNRLDLRDLLEAIVDKAATLLESGNGAIYLARPEAGELELHVGTGVFAGWIGDRIRRGEGMLGRIWDSGQIMRVDDYATWPSRVPGGRHDVLHAGMAAPLTSESQFLGILGVAHTEPGRTFGEEDQALLEQFARLASIALDNARLYAQAQDRLRERERAERQLREAEARFRNLVEQIPAITYIASFEAVRGEHRTTYVSPQIQRMLGYSAEEFTADPDLWPSLIHPEDRAAVLVMNRDHYSTGEPLSHEYRLIARDGRVVWVLNEAAAVRDGDGGLRFSQGILYDVTERRRVEEGLERALHIERRATERLRALDDLKNTFLHAVSHELRTPLSAVLGFALTLEREEVRLGPSDRIEMVRRLAANARKLDQLLSDLLDLDRLDRGIAEPRRKPTDVAVLVRRVVENSEVLGTRPVRVDAELVVAPVDGPKVERIVENLLVNASRHTPPGSTISVRVGPHEGGVLIVVEDEGSGVPDELKESIFEPFRQGPEPPAHAPGVGIGLSLVSRFAELHGGRAWVEDRPGAGASFRVFLPGGTSG